MTWAVYHCARGSNNLSMGLLSCATLNLTRIAVCLPVHRFRNSLKPYSMLKYIHTSYRTQPNSLQSIKLITLMFYFLDLPLCSISWISFVCLLEHPSTPASGTLPTVQQHNGYFVSTPFISSTHHCLSLLIAFNTLFLSRFPLFSSLCGHNTSVMRVYKHGRPIV